MSPQSETTRPPLAVTGLGIVSAAGAGVGALLNALRRGTAGAREVPAFREAKLPFTAGARIPAAALGSGPVSPGEDRAFRMSARAAAEALLEADLLRSAGKARIGLCLGTALGAVEQLELFSRGGPHRAEASALWREMPLEALTAKLAARFTLSGPARTFSMTCASGLCALEQAACDLELGRADAVLVGGVDTLSLTMQAGFSSLRALSASGRYRPFEAAHDGIVLGEAAAFIVVERPEALRRRGAHAVAQIAASALASDAHHLTSPDESGRGMARAIVRAIGASRLAAGDLATATFTAVGSPIYDRMQTRAIRLAFGAAAGAVAVTTWERATGHALSSTAIVGIVHAAAALRVGRLPRALSRFAERGALDPVCDLHYLDDETVLTGRAILNLTVGFGGQNGATVVVRSPEGE